MHHLYWSDITTTNDREARCQKESKYSGLTNQSGEMMPQDHVGNSCHHLTIPQCMHVASGKS